jgi:hypothetical protein
MFSSSGQSPDTIAKGTAEGVEEIEILFPIAIYDLDPPQLFFLRALRVLCGSIYFSHYLSRCESELAPIPRLHFEFEDGVIH